LTVTGSLAEGNLTANVTVKNVGSRDGAEVVQLYVSDVECSELRPRKELKGFEKIALKVGEVREVKLPLTPRSFSFYDNYRHTWILEAGRFELLIGSSSRDIRVRAMIDIA
jgi:beta-glucosidase